MVARSVGPGVAECVYGNAFQCELSIRNIPFEREHTFKIYH
jgi:hypothetical protein